MIPLPLLEDAGASPGSSSFILLGGVLLIMWLVVFLPERKARKKKEAMLAAIKKNDRVLLTSGMYATVAAVNELRSVLAPPQVVVVLWQFSQLPVTVACVAVVGLPTAPR